MSKRLTSIVRRSEERGVALILTLAILALVTLLLIAFVTSMRIENMASKNFNQVYQTRELARAAVDQAVGQIRAGTPQRLATVPFYYVTAPGVIYTNSAGNFGPVYLYPGGASVVVPTDLVNSTNLNAGFWITGQNNVDFALDANSQINVGWLYVAQDGFVGPYPVVGHGPLIGRYTYWVDDESCKINLNTARQPSAVPSDPLGSSANIQVDLNMLAGNLSAFVTPIINRQVSAGGPGYTTIEEVKIPDGTITAATDFTNNQFYLTTYSDDSYYPTYLNTSSDLDTYEQQRLLLSGLVANDIDGTRGRDSAFRRLSDSALNAAYASGSTPRGTFQTKYTQVGMEQLIANIIGYQHDPKNYLTDPLAFPPDPGGDPPTYLGLCRAPYVNETQVRYDVTIDPTTSAIGTFTRTVTVELYYLYGADTPNGYVSPGETLVVKNLPVPAIAGAPTVPSTVTISVPSGTTFGSRATAYQTFSTPTVHYDPTPGAMTSIGIPAVGPSAPATSLLTTSV